MFNPTDQKAFFELSKSYLKEDSKVWNLPPTEQVDQLRELIEFHEWRYYIMNAPVISDF